MNSNTQAFIFNKSYYVPGPLNLLSNNVARVNLKVATVKPLLSGHLPLLRGHYLNSRNLLHKFIIYFDLHYAVMSMKWTLSPFGLPNWQVFVIIIHPC